MNEDQRRELLLLAEGLGTLPKDRFKMVSWGKELPGCDFAGCAIGWAPRLIPDCGLRLVRSAYWGYCFHPSFHGLQGMEAVALYFGLTLPDANFLFHSDFYGNVVQAAITPEIVSARIQLFLESRLTPRDLRFVEYYAGRKKESIAPSLEDPPGKRLGEVQKRVLRFVAPFPPNSIIVDAHYTQQSRDLLLLADGLQKTPQGNG